MVDIYPLPPKNYIKVPPPPRLKKIIFSDLWGKYQFLNLGLKYGTGDTDIVSIDTLPIAPLKYALGENSKQNIAKT